MEDARRIEMAKNALKRRWKFLSLAAIVNDVLAVADEPLFPGRGGQSNAS